jgi:hypothetical protein
MSIVGLPRTGKTTLAAKLFTALSKNSACLFCNVQNEPYFAGFVPGRRADVGALLSGTTQVWNCDPWEVKPKLLEIFLAQRASKTLNPLCIFVDEAHLIAKPGSMEFPESGHIDEDCIIGVLCTTGCRWNIRMIWITQRPQFVDSGVYKTSRYFVFFTVNDADHYFFHRQGIDFVNPEWHNYAVIRS